MRAEGKKEKGLQRISGEWPKATKDAAKDEGSGGGGLFKLKCPWGNRVKPSQEG